MFQDGAQYTDVEFLLESLVQYNDRVVFVTYGFVITIYDEDGIVEETKFSLIENDEFRAKLYEKHPLK
jgi:hypothetical protein